MQSGGNSKRWNSTCLHLGSPLANPGLRLKEGMFADVTILGTGGMALVVPSEAVIDTGRRQVVAVRRNGAFIPAEVRTGR